MLTQHVQALKHAAQILQIPDSILLDEALKDAIAVLPANYNFEVTAMPTRKALSNALQA